MEKIERKHNHKGTKALQLVIFFIVMLAPFIAVGVKCGYIMLNPNAKDNYSGTYEITYKYESNEVNSIDDLITGNIYKFDKNQATLTNETTRITKITACYDVNFIGTYWLNEYTTSQEMSLLTKSNLLYLQGGWEFPVVNQYIYFVYKTDFNNDYINCVSKCEQENIPIENVELSGTTDNVFYYATNQLSEEPLFSWTKETAMYTSINAMTTGFELGSGAETLSLLLTYWTLMTAIYIVIDIVIFVFTKITHLLQ